MKEADQLIETVGESVGYAKEYLSQQVELTKLELAEKIALITSMLVNSLVFFLLGLLVFSMGSIALGFYLGDRYESYAAGFLIVFGIYLFLFLLLFAFRRKIITNPLLEKILLILNSKS
jgi:hypothetical protein